ncbi:MAG: hypothetical protein DDT20_00941 [Firmicutes bacterium]|nr:hypothetical protein [Bacillota bacterium]
MPDLVDAALSAVELYQRAAEFRARGKSAPEVHPDFDGSHCIDCEDDIPVGRLLLNKVRCVYCQQRVERRV